MHVRRKTAPLTGKQLRELIRLGYEYRVAQRFNRQQASEAIDTARAEKERSMALPTVSCEDVGGMGMPVTSEPVSAETVEVSPRMAQKWIDERTPDFQRPLRDWHVDELSTYIRKGQFKTSSIEFNLCGGKYYLIDGQHRLHAICRAQKPVTLVVITTVVGTMDEVRHNYARTDTHLARSIRDAIWALNLAEEIQVSTGYLAASTSAVRLIANDFSRHILPQKKGRERSRDEMERRLREWGTDLSAYFETVSHARRSLGGPLRSSPCVAVGAVTMHYQRTKARPFWESVAIANGLRANSPEHRLMETLLTKKINDLRVDGFARAVAACWNAYYDDRDLSRLVPRPASEPILIEGTPWRGR